jgi:DNA-binding PadR family transcriptional regulator
MGAAIRDQINGDTTGVYLRDSTLYDLLKSMVRAELIEQLPGKKYRLTEKGRRKLELESRTLREAVSLSQQRLGWR